ncbi:MAG: 4-hydroxy-3-methylbut-2-enyl diphosphate reductase, partial [Lachnospiraceae bacterium]|nr:4-hydroxy-3-methylbut-2-enyl diphosphate reductase [Lachnospiraceae bacterium]
MEVKVARTAGFCFGVERAVRQVEELIQSGAKPLYTYGPIIHNEQVVEEFESRGVKALEDEEAVKQAEPGTIVLRSHGVSRREEEEIKNLGFHVVDATCPFVKKIHHLVAGAREEGRKVLIAGDVTHPEVQAIVGWCGEPPYVMASQEEIPSLPEDTPLLLVAQTTFHQEKFEKIVEII